MADASCSDGANGAAQPIADLSCDRRDSTDRSGRGQARSRDTFAVNSTDMDRTETKLQTAFDAASSIAEERGMSFDETLQFIAAGHSHG